MRSTRDARSLAATALFVAVSLSACSPAFAQDHERERELMLTETFDVSGQLVNPNADLEAEGGWHSMLPVSSPW